MKKIGLTFVYTLFVFKILPFYAVRNEPEPEPPEPRQNFYPEPLPHKNDAAPQHLFNVRERTGAYRISSYMKLIRIHSGTVKSPETLVARKV
jgi:hypothetical protein